MNLLIPILFVLMTFSSCMSRPQTDTDADEKLGLVQEEKRGDAEQALAALREAQRQEQRRNLERQITDPLTDASH